MQIDLYKTAFAKYFGSEELKAFINGAIAIINPAKRLIFIGNGGSNSICSHMMEDFMKIASKQTLSFSDPALITCFANDYGYDQSLAKWIGFNFQEGDILIAISSSGESKNIINAVNAHTELGGTTITLSGFDANNSLSKLGSENFVMTERNYGIVECFHQVVLHAILDEIA